LKITFDNYFKLKELLRDFKKEKDSKKMDLLKFIQCIEKHGKLAKKYDDDDDGIEEKKEGKEGKKKKRKAVDSSEEEEDSDRN